jgi:hypothetical protein
MDNPNRSSRANGFSRNNLFQSFRRRDGGPAIHSPPPPGSPPLPSILVNKYVPIHKRPLAINPQSSSPFYNGRIPPEIRNAIFDYALTEYTKADPASSQYMKNTNYTRPGYTGKKTVDVALLRICRRTYLETYHLPPVKKEHVFWHARGPPNHPGSTLENYGEQEMRYFERLHLWQMELVKEIHLFTQSFWLEGVFLRMVRRDFLQRIEKVKITIRRGDWWWNESNHLLAINPQRGSGNDAQQMLRDWNAEKQGKTIPWNVNGWGYAFAHMKGLKELEMEFETSDDKKDELLAIVRKAKTWEFPACPMKGDIDLVLSADEFEPKWSTWQGPMCYWSDFCPYCAQSMDCTVVDPPNKGCTERMRLRKEGMGPLCHVATLRWRIRRRHEPVRA